MNRKVTTIFLLGSEPAPGLRVLGVSVPNYKDSTKMLVKNQVALPPLPTLPNTRLAGQRRPVGGGTFWQEGCGKGGECPVWPGPGEEDSWSPTQSGGECFRKGAWTPLSSGVLAEF